MRFLKDTPGSLWVGVLLTALCSHLWAESDTGPNFELSAANVAADRPEQSRLVVFVKVLFDDVQFVKVEDRFLAEYEVVVDVFDEDGVSVTGKTVKEEVEAPDLNVANSRERFRITRLSFDLPPKRYRVYVELQDLETLKKTVKTEEIGLRDFTRPENRVSDVLLLDGYSRSEDGQLVFYPRLSRIMRPRARLYFYFEVYDVPPDDSIEVQYEIVGGQHKRLWRNHYGLQGQGPVTQTLISIEGDSLAHGSYVAKFEVKWASHTFRLAKAFDWFVEGLPLELGGLDKGIEVLKYVASEKEYKRLMSAKDEDKYSEYLAFWKRHDPTPETPENEFRKQYYQRILYANEHYKAFRKEGWKTDMGWVYVTLGAPDVVDRNPSNQFVGPGRVVKAIEVWTYYRYSRQLVFLDENGYGDYRLANRTTFYDMIR